MACLLICQSRGILIIDVLDIAVAGQWSRRCGLLFRGNARAIEVHRRPRRRRSVWAKSWILERPVPLCMDLFYILKAFQ